MDLSLFATQVTKGGQAGSALTGGTNLLGNNAIVGGNAIAFWDAILSNIAEGEIETALDDKNANTDAANDKVKNETVDLALLQMALLGQDADQNLEEKLKELRIENIANNPENRIQQLTKMIEHLTSGLPTAELGGGSLEDLVSRLNKRLEKLEASLDAFRTGDFGDEGAPFELLIASGLNPAQLTRIADRIEEVEQKLGRELTVEDLVAGVGNIIPAPGSKDDELSAIDALSLIIDNPKTDKNSDEYKALYGESEASDVAGIANTSPVLDTSNAQLRNQNIADTNSDLANIINLVASMKNASTNQLTPALANSQATTAADTSTSTPLTGIPEQQMTNAEFKALFGGKNGNISNANQNFAKLNAAPIANDATLPTLPKSGDIALPTTWHEAAMTQAALSEYLGLDVQTGTPFNNTMQAVHAASASNHAGQNHPATQMVAAQITKSAQNSDTRSITLQLDPAELGRVEVRIEFGKDNAVKAYLTVEKPETLLMLQRDTAALEKALQNAGLETDSGSLEYQMASDDYGFGQEGDRRGNNGHNSPENRADSDNEQLELIETTINWNVDPETGHVRYNILA